MLLNVEPKVECVFGGFALEKDLESWYNWGVGVIDSSL